ncbi:hypothetical protein K437DRAFT_273691 [Tilletiaria anomala UBC 951]|uniref:PIN domain-containing protein n=1 Tax=Tilletiaria anomala (strain ATCC 24038 / CBS 436.72 / UBC 951) TaxID=1037660 RepID=A0A066W498_TILAU|nr:uncharacterized protein K437DRAFT_273691 [Tilletiaria anomala UBC 951]KDN47338.1 hypothetical protein K437DRAFT_273691 [Tilletiaria anomala UBC 951]
MGGTYADYWNEKQQLDTKNDSSPSSSRNGPVRLTISRGDYVYDVNTNELRYEEKWEEEELMESEDLADGRQFKGLTLDLLDGPGPRRKSTGIVNADASESLGAHDVSQHISGFKKLGDRGGFSLMLLDTNVLISHQGFLKHVFSLLLNNNIQYLTSQSETISPFAMIIPKVVLRELDGLKKGGRRRDGDFGGVERSAQEANVWILQALRAQKQWNISGVRLPEALWALHVQTQEHLSRHNSKAGSNDEQIVQLGKQLQNETGAVTILCSNDVNARLVAEAEGLATLELRSILEPIGTNDDKELAELAKDVLKQWCAQHQQHASHDTDLSSTMDEDVDMDNSASTSIAHTGSAPLTSPSTGPASSTPTVSVLASSPNSPSSRWALRGSDANTVMTDGQQEREGWMWHSASDPTGPSERQAEHGAADASGAELNPIVDLPPPRVRRRW